MKRWILRTMVWCIFNLRIYYMWSRVYQWLYEKRKWRQVSIPLFTSFEKIEKVLGSMVWRKDGWRELWDAISTPQATYGRFIQGIEAGDCDDSAVVAAFCLLHARQHADLDKPVLEAGLLSVPWLDKQQEIGGHNVCAFLYREKGERKWAYLSNWYNGRIQWGFPDKDAIVCHVLGNRKTLGWGYAEATLKNKDFKLKLTEYHWKVKGEQNA